MYTYIRILIYLCICLLIARDSEQYYRRDPIRPYKKCLALKIFTNLQKIKLTLYILFSEKIIILNNINKKLSTKIIH